MGFLRSFLVVILAIALAPVGFILYPHSIRANHFAPTDDSYQKLDKIVTHVIFQNFASLTLKQSLIQVNGVTLHVNDAGPKDASKLIVFIHGFPETGLVCWKHQIFHFANQGYRVIAPDSRGTNTSTHPTTLEESNHMLAAADIAALIEHYKYEKAIVRVIGYVL
jgi:dipeptidyl aminopeptidase/acylaminoacyl peptidase